MAEYSSILSVFGIVLLLGWFAVRLLRGRKPASAKPSAAAVRSDELRLWMLIQGDAGPKFAQCEYDDELHGYREGGKFFPREFCQVVPARGLVVLATHMMMPTDGDSKHTGDWSDLVEVTQPSWTAAWADFNRARQRLNWSSLWERGDGSMAGLKNIATALTIVCLLLLTFRSFTSGSTINSIYDHVSKPVVSAPAADADKPTGDTK